MIRQPIGWRWRVGLGVASVLLLAACYSYLSHRQHVINPDDRTMPSWSGLVHDGLLRVLRPHGSSGEVWFWLDAKASFGRLFLGLFVGVLASVVLGLLMGCYAPIEAFFAPPLAFLAKIPPTAMLAVF